MISEFTHEVDCQRKELTVAEVEHFVGVVWLCTDACKRRHIAYFQIPAHWEKPDDY